MWLRESVCLQGETIDTKLLARQIYERTCRTTFDAPGFCAVNLGHAIVSVAFREIMVDLKRAMAVIHEEIMGKTLIYLSAARFDQQTTTKLHLDGGPEECFLMLGYEPSGIDSVFEVADYTRCAVDLRLTPSEFLARHNPMFVAGAATLHSYVTRIPCFSSSDFQIICVNNSSAPYDGNRPTWQGMLHTATIHSPDASKRRVINSTMIASVELGTPDVVTEAEQSEFVSTSLVRRRGYDKMDLEDDR